MSYDDFYKTRTELSNALATAAAELMAYTWTSSARVAIPDTEPQQYVIAGTLDRIAHMLPNFVDELRAVPAAQAPSQVPAEIQGMADCMHMVREELIEAGIIDASVAPMFIVDAVIKKLQEVRLSAVREARNWQPIATVPMDGSEVLLYLQAPFTRVVKARWFDVWENWIEGEFPDPQDEYCGIGSRVPTHWMPVPEAPAASKEGGKHV